MVMRWAGDGRDVTDLPGLWTADDVEVCQTNFSHPTITIGQHTNGPARIWIRRCVAGAEWIDTGMTQLHRVRDAWCIRPIQSHFYGEIR